MGCVFGRFMVDSPPRKPVKSKRRHGQHGNRAITKKGSRKHHPSSKYVVDMKRESRRQSVKENNNNIKNNNPSPVEKKVSRGGKESMVAATREEKNIEKEDDDEEKNISRYEFVDGWPKWLVDNIPRHVLDSLVPKSADSYIKLGKVGCGTYSNVYKAKDKRSGKIVALKKVRFDTSDPESIKFMAREIMVLQALDHPNVIKLEGIATSRMQYSIYLVFEFMHADLTRIIARPGERLTEPQIKCYMQQLLCGLQHCHEMGVIHRDIKSSNLLVDTRGVLKIADFGLAHSFDIKSNGPLTNKVVTLWYRAPELLLGSTSYGFGIDLWSAGCLLAEMFVGRPIMPGRTEAEQLHMIFRLCGSPSDNYYRKLKLTSSYRPSQRYRPNYKGNFPNLPSSFLHLLSTLLDLDPNRRGSAASALRSEFFNSSPLPCDPSDLPAIYSNNINDEDERIHQKRRRVPKGGQVSQASTNHVSQLGRNNQTAEQLKKRDSSESSTKEDKKEQEEQGQETSTASASSTTSSSKNITMNMNNNNSASSTTSSIVSSNGTTEAHPSYALLHPSMIGAINHNNKEANDESHHLKALSSALDLRFDPEKLSDHSE
ncbi:hypothetical protein PIB30_086348 [Stylosanthes scabra]|uniref:Protein kinase domain-containing protein n=1 Tax=Stylosanthes scabra TaxID=79078 RepID=A0ABU6WWN0_9FABA|nr:hypothetical protein [Stylosanthes scabra]